MIQSQFKVLRTFFILIIVKIIHEWKKEKKKKNLVKSLKVTCWLRKVGNGMAPFLRVLDCRFLPIEISRVQ